MKNEKLSVTVNTNMEKGLGIIFEGLCETIMTEEEIKELSKKISPLLCEIIEHALMDKYNISSHKKCNKCHQKEK